MTIRTAPLTKRDKGNNPNTEKVKGRDGSRKKKGNFFRKGTAFYPKELAGDEGNTWDN